MSRARLISLVAALVLGLAGTTSCVEDDEYVTCANFDEFLYECYFNCARSFECEDNFELLDEVSQNLLLECSEGLQQQALVEDCSDYTVDGWSCKALMEHLLQGECEW